MAKLSELRNYEDEQGNRVVYEGAPLPKAKFEVLFRGKGNTLRIAKGAKLVDLAADFSGDDGVVEIGTTSKDRSGIRLSVRVGHESSIVVGENAGFETRAFIRVSEGQRVTIGEDCMFAAGVELRADDTHPIYDVRTGKRANPSGSIHIGEHVWLGKGSAVMGNVTIGSGAVVGMRSIVTRDVPNNTVAAGVPARVVRRDVAWERPVLSFRRPGVEGLGPTEVKSADWWNLTEDDDLQR